MLVRQHCRKSVECSLSTAPILATEEQVTNESHQWSDILIMTSVILSLTLLGDICHHCRIIVVA